MSKTFEAVIPFEKRSGRTLPIVRVDLESAQGRGISLPLLFDTGAAYTVLRHQLHHLLGVDDWRAGTESRSALQVLAMRLSRIVTKADS